MKIYQTEIAAVNDFLVSVVEHNGSYFDAPFHYHPEIELVYIKESHGNRVIGDKIEPFEAGDMVFVGGNLPHVWLNDEIYYKDLPELRAKAIVLYFNSKLLGPAFYNVKEFAHISAFLKKGERGIKVEGRTKELVAKKLEDLLHKTGIEKITGLFELCDMLAHSDELRFITSDGYKTSNLNVETDRVAEIVKYIHANYHTAITLTTISSIANLSPKSFCRMFKKRTNKHFIEYLNEVRISYACNFLLDTDWGISEIAYKCGYKTVPNFNKLFKEETGLSPKAYREKSIRVNVVGG
ncbi:MAG: AraC family transcriptional regulator [Bacteroidetes bacterium]|nr:AraC family transcriptional regulator [Bacteroidota bacterium]